MEIQGVKFVYFGEKIFLVQARGIKGSGEGKTLPLGEKILEFSTGLMLSFINFYYNYSDKSKIFH